MDKEQQVKFAKKKRTLKMMPHDFMGSFSDKASFYNYMKEVL